MKVQSVASAVFLAMTMSAAVPAMAAGAQHSNSQMQEQSQSANPAMKTVSETTVQMTATVESVDTSNRIVTLRGPQGRTIDVKAGDQVQNLDQLKPGDKVQVDYLRSVALGLNKASEAPPSSEFAQFVQVAPEGKQAEGVKAATARVTATIENIDKKSREVTVKGPRGNSVILHAGPNINLSNLKKGDQIVATFTEAVALSVKKAS